MEIDFHVKVMYPPATYGTDGTPMLSMRMSISRTVSVSSLQYRNARPASRFCATHTCDSSKQPVSKSASAWITCD